MHPPPNKHKWDETLRPNPAQNPKQQKKGTANWPFFPLKPTAPCCFETHTPQKTKENLNLWKHRVEVISRKYIIQRLL